MTLHSDLSALRFDELFSDGKSQTGAAGFAGARFIAAPEAIEHVRHIIEGDALTVILHTDFHLPGQSRRRDGDAAILRARSVPYRVAQQHAQHLRDSFAIRFHGRQIIQRLDSQRRLLFTRHRLERTRCRFDDRT